ncbi:hypothetical protein QLQ80_02475 [Mycoplasma sp. M5725]|uniref:Uncharacterized protein n=1 Tax=Mycoplasma phocimorsus TaxID=3045839 RepID=A0AAJ1PRD6_9MOLU|nr:hypothetical protein [Mycoplasma phocimorsus]MDJ1645934.1 hypothetical protein [Mycoplasma phocimorsus]
MNSKVVKLIGFANLTCIFNITTISCSTIKVKMDEVKIKYETLKGFESHKTKQVELSNLVKDQIILEKADLITKAALSPIVNKTIGLIQTAPLSTVKNVATFIHSESYKAYQKSSKSKTLIRKGITFLGTLALNGAISLVIYFEQYHPTTKHKIKSYLLSLLYAAIERFAFDKIPHNSKEFRELMLNLFRYSDIQKENLYTFLKNKIFENFINAINIKNIINGNLKTSVQNTITKTFNGEIFKEIFISGTGLLSSWMTDMFKNEELLLSLLNYFYKNKDSLIKWSFNNKEFENFFKEDINELNKSENDDKINSNIMDLFFDELKQNNNEIIDLKNIIELLKNFQKENNLYEVLNVLKILEIKDFENKIKNVLNESKKYVSILFVVFFVSLIDSIKIGLANYQRFKNVEKINEKVNYFICLILKFINKIYQKVFVKSEKEILIKNEFRKKIISYIMAESKLVEKKLN